MRHWHWLVLGGILVGTPWAAPAPVELQKPNLEVMLPPFGVLTSVVPCKGGERSVAIASTLTTRGPLAMYVYDAHGNCIARDEYTERLPPGANRRAATDAAAVEWFSLAPATYALELRNQGNNAATLQMAIR
jgi:hypothetical protein